MPDESNFSSICFTVINRFLNFHSKSTISMLILQSMKLRHSEFPKITKVVSNGESHTKSIVQS